MSNNDRLFDELETAFERVIEACGLSPEDFASDAKAADAVVKWIGVAERRRIAAEDALEKCEERLHAARLANVAANSLVAVGVLERSVDDLELSVRSSNCLHDAGIRYIGELIQCSEKDLLKIKHFGIRSLREIKKKLGILGLALAPSEE